MDNKNSYFLDESPEGRMERMKAFFGLRPDQDWKEWEGYTGEEDDDDDEDERRD